MHSIHQPSPSQSVLVRSSLCIPPTGNPPLQSVRVCPTSASAPTVHCVSELVLSSSTPVNENHFCSPHNRQPDRNQCLWIPWCAFHYVLPFCSFCLLAITPMQSVPVCPLFLQSLQHQSSLLLNFLPLGNQLIHIILCVQLSSHCLRIQLPHAHRAFSAQHVLGHRSPPRHSRATDYSLPSCTFSARHLWVTVTFGRGFQVVSCTSPRCCFSLFNISLPYLHTFLPLGNQLIHVFLFVQLSSPADPASPPTKGFFRPSCPWPPLSSSPQPRHSAGLTRHPVQIFSAADLAHLASHLAESTRTLSHQAHQMEALSDISD